MDQLRPSDVQRGETRAHRDPSVPHRATKPHRRPRKTLSCEPCRTSKLRCDRQHPCGSCQKRECEESCEYRSRKVKPPPIHAIRTPSSQQSSSIQEEDEPEPAHPCSAAAAAALSGTATLGTDTNDESTLSSWDRMLQRPTHDRHDPSYAQGDLAFPLTFGPPVSTEHLLTELPPPEFRDFLIARYFDHYASLFRVLHGPTFQRQYSEFLRSPSETSLSWLSLLFVVCSFSLYSLDSSDPAALSFRSKTQNSSTSNPLALSRKWRGLGLACLSQDQFLVHHDLNTLESLLVLIYSISHTEGVERGWTLLGLTLNMGIAMKCHMSPSNLDHIEKERRHRCWHGILLLHTYQGILFRDINMAFLLNMKSTAPSYVNDVDIKKDTVVPASSEPNEMSLMRFKYRLFQLSTRICSRVQGPIPLDQDCLKHFHKAIQDEQADWDATYLPEGTPSVLDTAGYAHWGILQSYAHQLYLIIHRPFYHSQSRSFLPESRAACLKSGMALLDFHRDLYELPRLRYYRWLIHGMMGFNLLQGAVALASCLIDQTDDIDITPYRVALDGALARVETLQSLSPMCNKAYPIINQLQAHLNEHLDSSPGNQLFPINEEWADLDWFSNEYMNTMLWEGVFQPPTS